MPLVAAAGSVPSDVDEVSCALPRRRPIVMVGYAQGDVSFGQQPEYLRRVPAGMAEFETVAAFYREQLEKRREPVGIGVKLRRQLEQDRTGFVTQQREAVFKQFKTVDGIVRQAFPVGDEFGCLPGEYELLAGRFAPAFDRFRRRCSIKYAVQFGGRKLAGVILKLVFERQALGKKRSAPGIVVPAGSPDQNTCHQISSA